ncbi:MAG: ParB/RepB/Spo0J family partition protein [Pirellulaceae bacterium]
MPETLDIFAIPELTFTPREDWQFDLEINPRQTGLVEEIEGLAASLSDIGIREPLHGQLIAGTTKIRAISGIRRLIAHRRAGLKTLIPGFIFGPEVPADKLALWSLTANIQRSQLRAVEVARAMGRLRSQHGLTGVQIAKKIGKSTAYVSQHLAILGLGEEALAEMDASGKGIKVLYDMKRVPREPSPKSHKLRTFKANGVGLTVRYGVGAPVSALVGLLTDLLQRVDGVPPDAVLELK